MEQSSIFLISLQHQVSHLSFFILSLFIILLFYTDILNLLLKLFSTHLRRRIDPTSYTGITYAGKGSRRMYDGRNGWIDVNAYLFTATFSDHSNVEFRCNPEHDYADAYNQASKYAIALGRILKIFRSRVDIFDLNRGKY